MKYILFFVLVMVVGSGSACLAGPVNSYYRTDGTYIAPAYSSPSPSAVSTNTYSGTSGNNYRSNPSGTYSGAYSSGVTSYSYDNNYKYDIARDNHRNIAQGAPLQPVQSIKVRTHPDYNPFENSDKKGKDKNNGDDNNASEESSRSE